MKRLELRLYIAGDAPNSATAKSTLRALLKKVPGEGAKLEVIDVLRDPERAVRDGVLVTPTTIRVVPAPERRVIGDLRNHRVVMALLGLEGEQADG
jgi:circadian clock protein KaiB